MASIGGLELKMPTGVVTQILSWGFWSMIVLVITGIVCFWLYKRFKNKVSFIDNVTLTKIFDNGTEKTYHGLKGGKYVSSHGAWDYRIKIPKQRKNKELGYMPDFSKADSDGTIHFVTCGDGTFWQQAEARTIIKEEHEERDTEGNLVKRYEYELLKKPIISSDEKNIMIKDIKNWRDVVAKNKVTAFAIGLGMFLIMVIAHLISLYIQTKVKCPSIP